MIDLNTSKILVEKRDYARAIQYFKSKGYWVTDEFIKVANLSSKVFFISEPSDQGRIFLCGERNCENCYLPDRGYFPLCKKLEIVLFDSREEKLKRILR